MLHGIRSLFETSKVVVGTAITSTSTWTAVATAPDTGAFAHPVRILEVNNFTDADLDFSFDGVNSHKQLMARTQGVWDISSNQVESRGLWVGKGTILYARRIGVPTTGSVYVGGTYGVGE